MTQEASKVSQSTLALARRIGLCPRLSTCHLFSLKLTSWLLGTTTLEPSLQATVPCWWFLWSQVIVRPRTASTTEGIHAAGNHTNRVRWMIQCDRLIPSSEGCLDTFFQRQPSLLWRVNDSFFSRCRLTLLQTYSFCGFLCKAFLSGNFSFMESLAVRLCP